MYFSILSCDALLITAPRFSPAFIFFASSFGQNPDYKKDPNEPPYQVHSPKMITVVHVHDFIFKLLLNFLINFCVIPGMLSLSKH